MRYNKNAGRRFNNNEALLSSDIDNKASKHVLNRDMEIKKTVINKKKKHKKNFILHYIILIFFFLTISIILSLTILFPLKEIDVIGTDKVTPTNILEVTDIIYGANLFRLPIKSLKEDIINTYVDIQDVNIVRKIPNNLVFEFEEAVKMANVLYAGNRFTISKKGRITNVLETQEKDESVVSFNGLDFSDYKLGDYFLIDDDKFNLLSEITNSIYESDIKHVIHIDVSDIYSITMYYSDNLVIKVGNTKNLTDKLNKAQIIIDTKLQEDDKGILDVSIPSTSYFRNEDNIKIPY